MLQNIPTHVIAGPLGAGKTSLLRHLLAQRPAGERWAVLINEFGQIGLDAALLATDADGVAMGEVAGGCLCCVNGAPFQVGLARLLRKARPHRLFIEPSGLGHPAQLLAQLRQAPWQGVLVVQPAVLVLDAQALAAGQVLPQAQAQALGSAGLLVLNKAEGLDAQQRLWITEQLPALPMLWVDHGKMAFEQLPAVTDAAVTVDNPCALPDGAAPSALLWTDPTQPICVYQQAEQAWSIGWRWHPSQQLDLRRLKHWLAGLGWRRAKMVIHSPHGWRSANALEGQALEWQASEWRRDSRIELIYPQVQGVDALEQGMRACRIL
ncbi:CobW family GTP-binding protein [Pseudomonas aegrilactucae]|uniref:Cobalamin biosynthesis protein CobW n=1 Tax=Pseudomonas aegrilactucae TaxID=2854028 RepID=A0A9Q2XD17_9PSED|nr:CobW-like GTP-binding protein [Pseudomonas aegrilactucae]MBV6285503.1 cobalamin biosynthesis protein CobW [Pseudomonas aegrilactucae]